MLFIYVELRYQRQLNRICPDMTETFFSSVADSASRNGGIGIRIGQGMAYQFKNTSVGYAFSASRFISDVEILLEKFKDRIREYTVLVDTILEKVSMSNFSEHLSQYETLVTPDKGILFTSSALEILSLYIATIPILDSPFCLFSEVKATESIDLVSMVGAKKLQHYSLYLYENRHVLFSIFSLFPLTNDCETSLLSEEERIQFEDSFYAVKSFLSYRFNEQSPDYLISSCIVWLGLRVKLAILKNQIPIKISVFGDTHDTGDFLALMDVLKSQCKIEYVTSLDSPPLDLKNMPQDLIELAWLVYRASSVLFIDEYSDFFSFLGKESDFISSLGNWLYSSGILFDPFDLRSINHSVIKKIALKLKDRINVLDHIVADYVWKMYQNGELQPVKSLYDTLEDLQYELPDSFKVSCLFHDCVLPTQENVELFSFKNSSVEEGVTQIRKAIQKYELFEYAESGSLAREALHNFQRNSILSGEYQSLSLIALLSLVNNKGSDAVVYFEYALENAEKMHEPLSILQTRFDMAMVYFVIGNYHVALCTLDSLDKIVQSSFAKDREVLILFMKGRLFFEMGSYRQAEVLFQAAATLASVYGIAHSISLCRVWYARSLLFQNRFASAENILVTCIEIIPEAHLFLCESALLSGRTISEYSLPSELPKINENITNISGSLFGWTSGFANVEDRCFREQGSKNTAERLFIAVSISYKVRFLSGIDFSSAINELSAFARRAVEIEDPYAYQYYYWAYELGSKTGVISQADLSSWLSRGFKYLQKRANEISDNSMREQFMQAPVLNSRLYRSARASMLI
ncbi:MAG TPA: hypothetical protein VJ861_13260 [Treponemataceae bacterium]|nr:hypothetical protein [Treponemataceae bacterium]